MSFPPEYIATAERVVDIIFALIPNHPEIMTMSNPFDLFKIKDFKLGKLDPSFAQAGWALGEAQRRYHAAHPHDHDQEGTTS